MRKKLKKYNLGGGTPGGSFISGLLDNLNAVPVNGQVIGNHMINNGVGDFGSNIALMAMNQFASSNIPPNLLGQYRRQSLQSSLNGGIGGQFNFMNQFMADNNLPKGPTPINRDPFQFMPQVGFDAQREADMDASDQSFQFGPLNTAGPQIGMPVTHRQPPMPITGTPAAGLPSNPAQPFTMPSIPGASQSQYMLSGPGGIDLSSGALGMVEPSPPPADILTGLGSGLGQTNVEQSLGQSILGEANEFDQANAAINKAKGTVSTLKKIIGEDTFKSHAAKLLEKIPGKVGEKIGAKVATSAVEGAGTKFGSFLGSNAGAAASFGVGLLGKGIQELDKKDGNYSRLGAMGGGALQGAALGSMLGPLGTVAGGLIGAGVGELQRKKFEHDAEMRELTQKTILAKDNARTRLQSKQILANVPTQGIKDQIYEEGGPVGGGKTPAREKYIPEGDEITLEMLSQYLTDTRSTAEDPYDFSAAADTIAYHESGLDPQKHQLQGGPGRGLFQYEPPSALSASNRLKSLAQLWDMPNPEWNTVEGTKDFSKLSIDQQKMLWMADKLMDKTVDLAALGMGEEPLVDFWADHHWRGDDKDRKTRQRSFESKRLPAKMFGLPDFGEEYPQPEPEMDMLTPDMELPYNPLIMGGLPTSPEQLQNDTLKISFELGGPAQGGPGGFLSSTARGGFPKEKAFKSYYPTTSRYDVTRGDTREQGFSQGYTSGLKELIQLYKTAGGGGERKIIGIPTGRRYVDIDQHAVRNTYKDNEPVKSRKFTYKEKRDDIEKTYDKYKGYTVTTPEGGKSKTVETGGADLNWFQRNFPSLATERYKVKSKYGPDGNLLRRVTTSRAGGREVKEYPTQAELDAMIASDIQAVQTGVKPNYALGGDTDPTKLVTSPTDPALTAYNDSLNLYNLSQQLKNIVPSARDIGGGSQFFSENRMVPQEQSFPLIENRYFNLSEIPGYEGSDVIVSGLGDEQSYNVDKPATAEDLKRFKREFAEDRTKLTHYEVSHPSIKPTGIYDATSGDGFNHRMLRGLGMDPYSSYNATYNEPSQEVKLAPVTKNYINKTLTANPLDSVGLGGADPIKPPTPPTPAPKKQETVKEIAPPPAPKKKEKPAKQNVKPEPVYIFNAANTGGKGSTRTGQVPRAKRVWDDKRKQWKEVPLTQEEIDAYKAKYSFALGGGVPGGDDDQGPSITPDDPRFDQHKAYAEAMYGLRHPYADLNLPPSGRTDYTFGPIDTMLGIIPFARLSGTLGKRAVTQGLKKFVDGRNVGFPLGKYGKREVVQGIRREAPLLGFEQLFGLNLMGSDAAQDYPLKEYKERRKEGPKFEPAPYGYGGNTDKFDYVAEGGEVIVHKPGDVPDTDQNGYLTSLGPNVKMINGDKHSAPSGGVKMGQDESAFIYSDKLKLSKEMQKKIYGSNGKLRF